MEAKVVQLAPNPWSARGDAYAASAPHRFGPSLPRLLALARPVADDHCLDIGTGAGHTAAQLALRAARVVGLDPAEGMLEAARRAYGHLPRLELVCAHAGDTGFPDATFNLVTARHTLHHHPSVPATLAEVRRVLKPGGRLVIVDEITPNREVEDWYHRLELTRDPTHRRAYTMDAWRRFISEAGLEWVVGDAETRYTIEVDGWLERMNPTAEAASQVRRMLQEAPEPARRAFAIAFQDGRAVRFEMPMALILATRPPDGVTP